ncbi:DUF2256 and DUF3253 domain-containing protein [Herbiconiux sp. CPCC 203407]|uniref:DUF2256 and DUF3253 domain-containing protein n=1 Tax=Herbiconiux oxytropis TaxID=2970915 RepID=A0AA41XE83_9MICO|nr:DUF2256 and DUF3253 domain-containing protein [Herbiconiux oxytropis]MCS5721543.1 DUF2256 and DUF3253 domain-containing protein [Herbiconiux oxytropis]MCS5724620.1 DUF2256 and DUF3253 domain-containing protein [Herbiconiux oxytropis]
MARSSTPEHPPKVCASCGRTIEWRAKWARSWDDVRYCSTGCRRRGVTAGDLELEKTILDALHRRPGGATLELDDVPGPSAGAAHGHREQVRRAARRLADRDLVEWLQQGHPVDPSTARGAAAIRLRR